MLNTDNDSSCCVNLILGENHKEIGKILLATGKDIDLDALSQCEYLSKNPEVEGLLKDFIQSAKSSGFQTYGRLNFESGVQQEQGVYRHRRGR